MTMYNSGHSDRRMAIVSSLAFVVGCAVGFVLSEVSHPPVAEILRLIAGLIVTLMVMLLVLLALFVSVMAVFILSDKVMRGEIL